MFQFLRFVFTVLSVLTQTFVSLKLYQWHLRPYFPALPVLTFLQMWGMRLALGMITGISTTTVGLTVSILDIPRKPRTETEERVSVVLSDVVMIVISLAALLVGYLLTL